LTTGSDGFSGRCLSAADFLERAVALARQAAPMKALVSKTGAKRPAFGSGSGVPWRYRPPTSPAEVSALVGYVEGSDQHSIG